ncbi:Zn-ribbon domain-containing OB-fold protein [Ottowia thiooxydans]|uniref:Zn-ribbon domain-containing OB-fold protein n=1 Tax=Ottowia thiooxydans TaxID=219182 RepID=UPI000425CF7F|nr:OB-fold domain-containing protein [Ottowia thiooxydans]
MATPYQDRKIPAPIVYPDNKPFWDAADEGRFLVKHCTACNQPHWYPRPLCPFCGSDKTEFRESPGTGTIYSLSVTRRAGPIAYAIAYVTLDEGVTMMTNIVDCDLDSVRIGDKVKVVFKPSDGGPAVPMFTPA